MTTEITKTYYWTNELENNILPPEFVSSKNKKWIVVEECKLVVNNKIVGDVILHASFVQRDAYLDHSVCFCNEEANRDTAKYEIIGYLPSFKLWFTDLEQNPLKVLKKDDTKKTSTTETKTSTTETKETNTETKTENSEAQIQAFTLRLLLIY